MRTAVVRAIAGRPFAREDTNVAADPHPYYALPRLFGGPAYARPPKFVRDSERPFDTDDLPIAVEQTEDERAFARMLPSGSHRSNGYVLHPLDGPYGSFVEASGPSGPSGPSGNGLHPSGDADGSPGEAGGAAGSTEVPGMRARRFSLRALTDRLGRRAR
jgi:hypothetical protein